MTFRHQLRLTHRRDTVQQFSVANTDSTVDVDASSSDLTAAWQELLSRLPSDVYAALKTAMYGIDVNAEMVTLLHQADGQLGLGVHRENVTPQWKREADELITNIRKLTHTVGSSGAR